MPRGCSGSLSILRPAVAACSPVHVALATRFDRCRLAKVSLAACQLLRGPSAAQRKLSSGNVQAWYADRPRRRGILRKCTNVDFSAPRTYLDRTALRRRSEKGPHCRAIYLTSGGYRREVQLVQPPRHDASQQGAVQRVTHIRLRFEDRNCKEIFHADADESMCRWESVCSSFIPILIVESNCTK